MKSGSPLKAALPLPLFMMGFQRDCSLGRRFGGRASKGSPLHPINPAFSHALLVVFNLLQLGEVVLRHITGDGRDFFVIRIDEPMRLWEEIILKLVRGRNPVFRANNDRRRNNNYLTKHEGQPCVTIR